MSGTRLLLISATCRSLFPAQTLAIEPVQGVCVAIASAVTAATPREGYTPFIDFSSLRTSPPNSPRSYRDRRGPRPLSRSRSPNLRALRWVKDAKHAGSWGGTFRAFFGCYFSGLSPFQN